MNSNMLSTTDTIKNCVILEQKGVVSARVVVGVGFFSEFFAGFTDIFGGRSQKLEDRLAELYEAALGDFEKELQKKDCNAAIGVKCDFDQIAGKGTFMFMLSISGTAVKVLEQSEIAAETPIMALARGKSIERELAGRPTVAKVSKVIDRLAEGAKLIDLSLLVKAIAANPEKEVIEDAQLDKIAYYLKRTYDPRELSRAFLQALEGMADADKSFYYLYMKCVLPYFEWMTHSLEVLNKNMIDKYIRPLEALSRPDYALEDASHIDAYLSELKEIGINVDEEGDEMLYRLYGIQSKKDTVFIRDLRDAILQYYQQTD